MRGLSLSLSLQPRGGGVSIPAIPQFVGSAVNATGTGATTISVDMSGIDIQSGDLIIVSAAGTATSDYAGGVNTAGYTQIAELAPASGTWRANMHVAYKIADGTETSVELVGSNYGTQGGNAAQARVYRGMSGLDVAAVTKATSTTAVDPDAITPVTDGAFIVVLAAAGRSGAMSTAYGVTGQNNVAQDGAGTQGIRLAGGDTVWDGAGAYDPPAWTGGNGDPGGSYCAVTLAIA